MRKGTHHLWVWVCQFKRNPIGSHFQERFIIQCSAVTQSEEFYLPKKDKTQSVEKIYDCTIRISSTVAHFFSFAFIDSIQVLFMFPCRLYNLSPHAGALLRTRKRGKACGFQTKHSLACPPPPGSFLFFFKGPNLIYP